jgi:AcrR family transcriptional regulator
MQNPDKNTDISFDTRERLLDAAEKLFCQKGFGGTSIRDITAEAGCNIAAVNYHFGGKEKLYEEMFRRRLLENLEAHSKAIDRVCAGANPTLETLLRELVRPVLESARRQDPWSRIIRLLVREALHHRVEIDKIVDDIKVQFLDRLAKAFEQLIPGLERRAAQWAVFSFESLVLHPILFLKLSELLLPDFTVEELTEHIVRFGAAGIRGCVEGNA